MLPYLATIVVLVLISRNAGVDPRQHAGVARQAVLPRLIIDRFARRATDADHPRSHHDRLSKRSLLQLAGWASLAALGALAGCSKKEDDDRDAPAAHDRAGASRATAPARRRRRQRPLKIAFAYVGPVGDGGWTFAHDNGRKAVEKEFGDKVADQLRREGARGGRRRARVPRHGRARATS